MLGIDRRKDSFGQDIYTCRYCGNESRTVAGIEHTKRYDPDFPITPFPESTEIDIRRIVSYAMDISREKYLNESDIDHLDGVKWTNSGSTSRVIVGLGKTSSKGDLHLPKDKRGIVLKIDPNPRTNTDVTAHSGNLDELWTYEQAVESQTQRFFADIFTCSSDGAWLVMEECTPIYPRHRSEMSHEDGIWDKDDDYIKPLVAILKKNGWESPDYKHGNIGLSKFGIPKMIDYGTGPTLEKDQ